VVTLRRYATDEEEHDQNDNPLLTAGEGEEVLFIFAYEA
jgi:hypothetical protein